MDHLRSVLSEAVIQACCKHLLYSTGLQVEMLLIVTVDNVTSLVFHLQGITGKVVRYIELLNQY